MDREDGWKILVVDDEPQIRSLIEIVLEPEGYLVRSAGDGKEALKSVQEDPPDVILLDITMPVMGGIEALKRLKGDEETRIIPVVIVSALSDLEDRVRALEAGADDFLTKPVNIVELKARVRSLLKVKAYNDHMRNYQRELEAEVFKRTEQLRDAFEKIKEVSLDTIHRLARAAEYKDEETGAHILRMSRYSSAIARRMGLGEEMVETILYASPMHDVGKIGIPDNILFKPGRLEEGEREIMKKHTLIGGKILEGSDLELIRIAEMVALTHHERWDGNGYPKGLKGEEIPLVGRIVAVADVFDALTSRRPYKPPLPLEESFEIIREGRGSQFDPEVVGVFFALKDEINPIKEAPQIGHSKLTKSGKITGLVG